MGFFDLLLARQTSQVSVPVQDTDFADFAEPPPPSPAENVASTAYLFPSQTADASTGTIPYTKWYRVWERTSPTDFYTEAILIPFMVVAVLVHLWGTKKNKKKARKWVAVHMPLLDTEFSLVGYIKTPKKPEKREVQTEGLLKASTKLTGENLPEKLLKEKTAYEFQTYATGRQNVAFLDFKVMLLKRYNPILLGGEYLFSLFFDSISPPVERMEATMYAFDGREKDFVTPSVPGAEETGAKPRVSNSTYDPFVFAIVNKMSMRRLRDQRYDVSLAYTKDHPKLPAWATVMTESAEITEMMLTPDVVAAVEQAGEALEYLIVTDQPVDKPTTLDETLPKKRLHLSIKIPSNGDYSSTLPLVSIFIRLSDNLAQNAHFRPEVKRKVIATREAEMKKLKKVSEKEAEEERLKVIEKMKKEERDRKMRGMTADEQRKFLEKEAERGRKKQEKKMSRKA